MSTELQRDIHKILVEDFSKAMGFDKETGVLPNGKKRFSGMPFIGNDYGEYSPKIVIVGSDIGRDECVKDNAKDINGTPLYFHDFDSKRKNCVNVAGKYNAHLAGTYMTALYLLRKCDKFKDMWQDAMCNTTAIRALKTLETEKIHQIADAIALTNLHKFVTIERPDRSGDKDRKWIDHDKEFATFIEEVKCFAPDIVIIQRIGLLAENDLMQIKQIVGRVYTLPHPSSGAREQGGCNVQKYIIDYLK